jgi:hypothetical protein
MNVDSFCAGREMDALVAAKVMGIEVSPARDMDLGWEEARGTKPSVTPPACVVLGLHGDEPMMVRSPEGVEPVIQPAQVYRYSTDIAAAWQVVEKLCATYPGLGVGAPFANRFSLVVPNAEPLACRARFCYQGHINEAGGETAPLAICRAALKACEMK